MMADIVRRGAMIWGNDHRYGEVYNFQVQMYKGEPYLTFWAGDDSVGGHGEGKYYMVSRPNTPDYFQSTNAD